jgi:hypothetical protein
MCLVQITAEPMWLDDVRICENLFLEMREKIVLIATAACFLTDLDRVKTQPCLIVFDHAHGGMTAPAS